MLAAAMMVATISASAQVYIGGGINFNSHNPGEGDNTTTIGIRPEIGYKLDDKLSIGIGLGFDHSKTGDKKTSDWKIAPYARYTFAKWNNVSFFGEAEFAYGHNENTVETDLGEIGGYTAKTSVTKKTNTWSLGVRPGVAIDVTKNLTFLTKIGWLGYESSKEDADGAKAVSDFGFNVSGENIQFALLYNF